MSKSVTVKLWYQNGDKTRMHPIGYEKMIKEGGLEGVVRDWTQVAEFEYTNEVPEWSDLKICNAMFEKTNADWEQDSHIKNSVRAFVSRHKKYVITPTVRHTSMSMGDIVEITREGKSRFYLCSETWDEIKENGELVHL